MNDREARRERRIRRCERLADIAMELTEAARVEALKEFQPPPARRNYAMPGMPSITLPDPTPFGRSTTFNDLVMQLSRCARQAILLEARLDSGADDRPPPELPALGTTPATPRNPDPTRETQRGTSDHMRLEHERLEDDLAADANRSPADILAGIAAELTAIVESRQLPNRAPPTPAKPHHPPAIGQPPRPPKRKPTPNAAPPRPPHPD